MPALHSGGCGHQDSQENPVSENKTKPTKATKNKSRKDRKDRVCGSEAVFPCIVKGLILNSLRTRNKEKAFFPGPGSRTMVLFAAENKGHLS